MQITVLDARAAAPTETAELVARARNGDRVAWDGLVDRYGGTVWAVAPAHGLTLVEVAYPSDGFAERAEATRRLRV